MTQKHWPVITGLVFLAAILRLYRISEQSIWLDEYLFVGLFPAETLRLHFILGRALAPELCLSPLYFLAQYVWAHWVDLSICCVRLFPIGLTLLGIPVAYALGVFVGGRCIGTVAALFLALSPQQIWYAQELRPYAPMAVVAMCSFYAMLRASESNRFHWWLLNTFVNMFLMWIYALGGLVFMVEGLFLLLFSRRSLKTLVVWSAFQFCIIIPWVFWALQTPFVHGFSLDPYLNELLNALFFDDIVSRHGDLLPPWKTNPPELLSPTMRALLLPRRVFDGALAMLLLGSTLYGSIQTVKLLWKKYRRRPWTSEDDHALECRGLLILAMAAPGITLSLLELTLRMPFLGSMYIMYGTLSLYVFLGLMVHAIPHQRLRHAIVAVAIVLYAYQLAILLPAVTRTNYHNAAAHIRDTANPSDQVAAFQWMAPGDLLGYYLGDAFGDVKRLTTMQGACDHAYEVFKALPENQRGQRALWFTVPAHIFQLIRGEGVAMKALEEGLRQRGLYGTRTRFPGKHDLNLYEIRVENGILPEPPFPLVPMPFSFDENKLLEDLQLDFSDEGQRQEVLYTLRGHLMSWPPIGTFIPMMDSLDLNAAGEFALAKAMAAHTLREQPGFGMAHFAAGLACAGLGDNNAAAEYFALAFERHPGLAVLVGPYTEALLQGDVDAAEKHLIWLSRQGHVYFAEAMHALCAAIRNKNTRADDAIIPRIATHIPESERSRRSGLSP